jgi:hypothetical protein
MSKTTYRQIREKPIDIQETASSSGLSSYFVLRKGGFRMEGEKREERKEIIVLDEGIASHTVGDPGPESVCCWFLIIPFRW